MSNKNEFYHTKNLNSPLDYALKKRTEPIIDIVTRAIERKNVLLAYQPIVHSKKPFEASVLRRLNSYNG